ncbi:MAG TPA: hypothetical protein VM580_29750, partial [Labilithrix sp.]|nr:hypothetical protein [Labilithrix sp.]
FAVLVSLVVATAWLLRGHVPQIAIALPLTFCAILPIYVTGTRGQMLPTAKELAVSLLRPTRDALASVLDLAHVDLATIGRFVGDDIDEIRLACAPRDRTPGLRAIEIALAVCPSGHGAMPEVFVRFDDGSAAAQRIAGFPSGAKAVTGRTPEERVVRLSPTEPSPLATAALVARLHDALEGRRATDRPNPAPRARWRGTERRRPLVARTGPSPLAPRAPVEPAKMGGIVATS